jgi:hypothetical protein
MVYGAIAFIAVAVLVFASSDRAMRLDLAVISGLLLTMLVLIQITPNR